jgi:hypothetical protein
MFKSKRNDISLTNYVNVVSKGRENTREKILTKHCNAWKWASAKKILTNNSPWLVLTKELMMDNFPKGFPKGEWWLKKGEILKQLASCYMKIMKNDSLRDGVKNICDIHLQHHSIGMHIQTTQHHEPLPCTHLWLSHRIERPPIETQNQSCPKRIQRQFHIWVGLEIHQGVQARKNQI